MGWGEATKPYLSTSARITAHAERDRWARKLAEAVAAHRADSTTGNAHVMYEALDRLEDALGAM